MTTSQRTSTRAEKVDYDEAGAPVTVPQAGFTQIAFLRNINSYKLCFGFDVAAQGLAAFRVRGRPHPNAQYQIFGVPGNSWTDPSAANSNVADRSRIKLANANLDTVGVNASGYFEMDISGLVDILIECTAAADGAQVTPHWSLQ